MLITNVVSTVFSNQVDIGDIGDVVKIRLEHNNANSFPAWHVKQVSQLELG